MADISKCSGEGCDKKEQCYRFTAPSSYHQSFFSKSPMKENGDCEYFWKQ